MALSDGDLFVSGSILSYQQANRIYQNFRGATVPSALQAGALWSDSDDNRLWHQGTTLDEVFTEKTTLTFENLLSNSGFGVWSQSDASKGLATITYDTGAKGGGSTPSVGDTIVGGTSGATAKLISYTTTDSWDAGNAYGVLTVGAVSHDFAFVDNETLTFDGDETCLVNMPSSAVGVGLVQNGGFAVDEDPPNGWTGVRADLTTEGAGEVTNCMMVTHDGGAENCYARSANMTVVAGKIYKFSAYVKQGTESTFDLQIYDVSNTAEICSTGDKESGAGWVLYTKTFESPSGCVSLNIRLWQKCGAAAGTTIYFDEVTLYEITPCCTAADAVAFDGWEKDTTIDIYRQHDDGGTLTKDGSFYSLKFVNTAANDFIKCTYTQYYPFIGRLVTAGIWAKTSTASHCRIRLYDGTTNTYSSYHTGGGDWEWLEVTATMGASATNFIVYVYALATPAVNGDTIVYLSQPMLVFGSHIGEGNYQPIKNEVVLPEARIVSNLLDTTADWSDVSWTVLNLEADSDGKLPKGCKSIQIYAAINDADSAAQVTEGKLRVRADSIQAGHIYWACSGLLNDAIARLVGVLKCDPNGDFQYRIYASGAKTLDIVNFRYYAVQVN